MTALCIFQNFQADINLKHPVALQTQNCNSVSFYFAELLHITCVRNYILIVRTKRKYQNRISPSKICFLKPIVNQLFPGHTYDQHVGKVNCATHTDFAIFKGTD